MAPDATQDIVEPGHREDWTGLDPQDHEALAAVRRAYEAVLEQIDTELP